MKTRKHKCIGFTENKSKVAIWQGLDCNCYYQTGDSSNVKLAEVREERCV